jgi:hypothetical protein
VVFALANPDPEIDPLEAQQHAAIVATGRSDHPNQINNVLAFPGFFRGLLDASARVITDGMLMAASSAIADVVDSDRLNASFIIPSVFDAALATARIAGIMAAKHTPDLIPLCHQIALSSVAVDLALDGDAVLITATARTTDRTGVEMEALTAAAVCGLTLHDMVKAVDPAAAITDLRVERKTGGKTGTWTRDG